MCGAISAQAWSRLQSYAIRVRSLTLSPSPCIHSSFWPFLAKQCAGAPLLPNLRALDACLITDLQVAPLLLLLSPSLREISVMFQDSPSDGTELSDILGSVLQNLALITPQLTELTLLGNHSLHREHLLHLERFTSMQEIRVGPQFPLDGAVLQALSKTTTIQQLTAAVRLRKEDWKETLDLGDRFHGLRCLELRGKHKDISAVFIAMSAPHIDLLSFEFTDSPTTNLPDSPFPAIASHVPDTITRFSATFCASLKPRPNSLADLLHPLPSLLPKLVSLVLASDSTPFSVTNDDLAQLGDAWPHLERLNVGHAEGRVNLRDAQRPNVWGLAALAKRCPHLERIGLPELDISRPTATDDSPEPQRADSDGGRMVPLLDHRLKELLFQSISAPSSTKAQHEAAVALDMLFPYLDLGKMRPGEGGPARSMPWTNMWKTLEIMRWGRKNRALADGGCEAAVPEVPEMPYDGLGDRRQYPPVHHLALHQALPNPVIQGWDVVMTDESATESE